MPDSATPVWLITGCSSGFGREIARAVLDRGWRAVVTARNPDQVADLIAGHEDQALALKLDVTDRSQIADVVAAATERFGRIDVLVNNAGYGYLTSVEEGEDQEIRAIFETNFFGLVAMTQAVLPTMRAQRSGCIVQMSSIGGIVSLPGTGYYHATKFAVEGLSGSLAKEVAPLGIKVINVEPGPFRTQWSGGSIRKAPNRIDDYQQTAGASRAQTEARAGQQVGDPVRAAEAIITAVQAPEPPLHLLLGAPAQTIARNQLAALKKDYDMWEELARGCDFPGGGMGL